MIFPDGIEENLSVTYICAGVPTNYSMSLIEHSNPKAGLLYKNGVLYLLVSLEPDEEYAAPSTSFIRLGNWSLTLTVDLTSRDASLTIEYVGTRNYTVKNALTPLTAGLDITLYSGNRKLSNMKKLGIYEPEYTVVPGEKDKLGFPILANTTLISIAGKILGKVPVEIRVPVVVEGTLAQGSVTTISSVVTVTVTETLPQGSEVDTSSVIQEVKCEAELVNRYPEPSVLHAWISESQDTQEVTSLQ